MTRLRTLTILLSALVVCVYGVTAYNSFGYDDEYFNIRLIEMAGGYAELVRLANSGDVHPPGQYIANKFLFDLLGDWSWVRVVNATLVSISLVALWQSVRTASWLHRLFAWLAICADPAILLWCTGLRWYAPFVLVTNLILLVVVRPRAPAIAYWGVVALGSLLLFYISYIALIFVPAIWLVALMQRSDRRTALVLGVLVLAAAVPQLKALLDVHIAHADTQLSSDAVAGLALHLFASQGAMPPSVFGGALIVANLLLLAVAVRHVRVLAQRSEVVLFSLGAIGLLITQLSGKIRNLVTLAAPEGLVQAAIFSLQPRSRLKWLIMGLFALGSLGGIYNVVTHSDTTKGSWNTPYREVLATVAAKTASCPRTAALTYDAVLAWHLHRRGVQVVDPATNENWKETLRPTPLTCIVALETFRGSLFRPVWLDYREALRQRGGGGEVQRFGLDDFAWFKRLFDQDVPDHYVTMTVFRPG